MLHLSSLALHLPCPTQGASSTHLRPLFAMRKGKNHATHRERRTLSHSEMKSVTRWRTLARSQGTLCMPIGECTYQVRRILECWENETVPVQTSPDRATKSLSLTPFSDNMIYRSDHGSGNISGRRCSSDRPEPRRAGRARGHPTVREPARALNGRARLAACRLTIGAYEAAFAVIGA